MTGCLVSTHRVNIALFAQSSLSQKCVCSAERSQVPPHTHTQTKHTLNEAISEFCHRLPDRSHPAFFKCQFFPQKEPLLSCCTPGSRVCVEMRTERYSPWHLACFRNELSLQQQMKMRREECYTCAHKHTHTPVSGN